MYQLESIFIKQRRIVSFNQKNGTVEIVAIVQSYLTTQVSHLSIDLK